MISSKQLRSDALRLGVGVGVVEAGRGEKSYCCFYSQVLKMLVKHYYSTRLFFFL